MPRLRLPRWIVLLLGLAILTAGSSFSANAPAFAADDAKAEAGDGHKSNASTAPQHHDEAEKPPVLQLQLNLGVYSLIVFLILMFILRKYAWDPITKSLDDREANLKQAHDDAESARSEAQRLQTEYQQKLDEAAVNAKEIVEEARRDADYTKTDIIKTANTEASAIKTRAEETIKLAKDEALKDLWERSAQLAVAAAGKVLSREMSGDDHRRLVDQALREMSAFKEATA